MLCIACDSSGGSGWNNCKHDSKANWRDIVAGRAGFNLAPADRKQSRGRESAMSSHCRAGWSCWNAICHCTKICASARISPGAAEAGVETVAAYRGQGCAQVAVEAWAAAVRESGRVPFYSTSWDNAASRAVARKLGLIPFAEDAWLELEERAP